MKYNVQSFLREEDIKQILERRDNRPEDEILKLAQVHNQHLPELLRVVGGNQGERTALFNSLVLAYAYGSEDNSVLSVCLDPSSLTRLALVAGGTTIKVPRIEELVRAHLIVLGLYAVKCKAVNIYKVFGAVNRILDSLHLDKMNLDGFKSELARCNKTVLKGLRKIHRSSNKSLLQILQDSVTNLENVADEIRQEVQGKTDNNDHLIRLYDKLCDMTTEIERILLGFIESGNKERKK